MDLVQLQEMILQVLVLQQKVVEQVDVTHLQDLQVDLAVVAEAVVDLHLQQVEQQIKRVKQVYRVVVVMEVQVVLVVLVLHKLQVVVVELMVLDNLEEFQNQVQLQEEQVKMFQHFIQEFQTVVFMLVVAVVENGLLNLHQLIQVQEEQVAEVQEQTVNRLQLQELPIQEEEVVVQVMVLVYLLLQVKADQE